MQVAKFILSRGGPGKESSTLCYVIMRGDVSLTKTLIHLGADLEDGAAIATAVMQDSQTITELLLMSGCQATVNPSKVPKNFNPQIVSLTKTLIHLGAC